MFVVGKRWAFSARYLKDALRLPWEPPRVRPERKATVLVRGRRNSKGTPRRSGLYGDWKTGVSEGGLGGSTEVEEDIMSRRVELRASSLSRLRCTDIFLQRRRVGYLAVQLPQGKGLDLIEHGAKLGLLFRAALFVSKC